jgi:hypothetical protein
MKKIYVHIGMHKTGTTSIQKMMHTNARLLLAHGIYYPTIFENHSFFLCLMFATSPEKWGLYVRCGYTTLEKVKKINACYRKLLMRELKNPKINTVIFSGEGLSFLSEEEVNNFSRWLQQFSDNVTIICAARNPVDWYRSSVQQTLKRREVSIASRCQHIMNSNSTRVPRYKNIVKYINCFGENAVTVFDFDKHKSNLCQYFLTLCGLDQSLIDAMTKKTIFANVSLSQEACFILDRLNTLRPRSSDYPEGYYEAQISAIARISGHKFKLPGEILEKILEYCSDDVEWISTNFEEDFGAYIESVKNFKIHDDKAELFQQQTVDDIALLIADLTHEIYKLKKERASPIFLFKGVMRKIIRFYRKTFLPTNAP